MASTPEGRVKAAIKKWLDERGFWRAGAKRPAGEVIGWYFMPVSNGMGVHGIPDFNMIYRGRAIYIEAKAPGKIAGVTAQQQNRHAEIRAAGGLVFVVDDVSQMEHIFELEAV